jgi:hypothetical protein
MQRYITVKARRNTYGSYHAITPVRYFTGAIKNHSRAVSHRNYFDGENEVFQRNRNDFPKVSFTLVDVI